MILVQFSRNGKRRSIALCLDISNEIRVPPNVKFVVDDVEQEWANPQPYDFIHCRYMVGSIRDWPKLVRQCYQSVHPQKRGIYEFKSDHLHRNLRPGGWVEFQDTTNRLYSEDGTLKPDNNLLKLMTGLIDACAKIGISGDFTPQIKGEVEKAGFVNVEEKIFKVPVGTWPKDKRLASLLHFFDC